MIKTSSGRDAADVHRLVVAMRDDDAEPVRRYGQGGNVKKKGPAMKSQKRSCLN